MRVPSRVTPRVLELAHRAVGHPSVPTYVPVQPIDGAKRDDCFANTSFAIEVHGGRQELGWRVAEEPFRFLEAEFHSLWLTPGGDRLDVTPNPIGAELTMYVPDPSRPYQGQQVNNVRLALADEPEVEHFLQALDDKFEFENAGDRALEHSLSLGGDDKVEYAQIMHRIATAQQEMMRLLTPSPGRNDPCPCGSGNKYKRCCSP